MEDFNGIFRKYKKEKEVEDSDSNKYTELFVMYTSLSSTVLPMIFPDSERFGKIEEVENLKLQNNILLAAALSMGKRAEGGFGSIQKHKQNGKNNRRGEGPIPETDFDAILKKLYNTREMIPDEMVNVLPSLFSKNNVLGYCDKYTKLFVMYTAMSSAILPMIFPDSNRFGKIKEVENLKLQNNILLAAALSMGKRAEGGFGSIQKHKQNGKNNRRGEGPIPETDFDAILKKLYNTREMIPDEMVNVLPSLFSKNNVLGYCDKYTKLFVMYTAMSSAILPMIFPDSNRFGKIKEVENLKLQNNILIAAALSMGKRAEGGFGSIPMEYARLEKGKKSVGERIKNNINKKTLLYLFFFIKIIYDFFS